MRTRRRNRRGEAKPAWYVYWKPIRSVLAFIVSLSIVCWGLYGAYRYFYQNYVMPVDPDDRNPITVTIESGSSLTKISQTLAESGVIRSASVFKYYVDFTDRSPKLKAGEYQFAKAMSMDDIIDSLMHGDGKPKVTYVTMKEGGKVQDLGLQLAAEGTIKDSSTFLELCRSGSEYADDYPFIKAIMEDKNIKQRKYALEGYLFPARYEVFVDASDDTIIRKMLDKTASMLLDSYYDRCDELDLSSDQVLTRASIIEKEAKTDDFAKVSAVFHNRLKNNMALESCATVQYAIGVNRLALTKRDIETDSPYNTYRNKGLPIGPICAPSQKAIEAALYPDEEFMAEGYLYFCLTDPATGELAFSKTLQEHNETSARYRDLWKQSDEDRGVAGVE